MNPATEIPAVAESQWPGNMYDQCQRIIKVADFLLILAGAATQLGLETTAIKLHSYAEVLLDIEQTIRDNVSNRIDSDLKAAEQNSAAMLRMALHTTTTRKDAPSGPSKT